MPEFAHFPVVRRRPGMNDFTDCLCLNGSAHAIMAQSAYRVKPLSVTCPKCQEILTLEAQGMSREAARSKVIFPNGYLAEIKGTPEYDKLHGTNFAST